ncbi:ABC transporter permease subunit [Cypionkella sp. TWP1-2-1b2]|uniref:ABC transporter permease subunit n=1 Tax=Cypionkella sp. TWP1-2-1b2 TaxID=2804675 RepID=UPI003CEB7545
MVSVPVFWVGITLIQRVSFKLGWVSVIAPGRWEKLVLPVPTLALPIAAAIAQILIRTIEDVSTRAFVPAGRAKGLSRGAVLWCHMLRNAALPTLAIAGVLLGELIAGAAVTQTVFGLNGFGRLAQRSVRTRDIAVLQAIVLISATGFVAISVIVDLVSWAD